MKIEKSGCCTPSKLTWSECKAGEVYQWCDNSVIYYMKLINDNGVALANGTHYPHNTISKERNWIHIPHAKLVV